MNIEKRLMNYIRKDELARWGGILLIGSIIIGKG